MPRSVTARRCLVRLHTEGALVRLRRGFGRRGDALEALFPLRTLIRLVEKGLVTIRTNSTNGIITARITNRGRYIVELMRGAVSLTLTQEWVLTRLMENAERALQHVAVLDKERKPTGEYRYDGSVANRALELLGKQQGMFIDRHEVGQPNEFADWTDEELKAFIKSGTEALGILPRKTQH